MNETVAERFTLGVDANFAGENVSKHTESVGKALVVDSSGKVFDEDVADTGSTDTGVSVGPHDSAGAIPDVLEVHGIQSTLS